jgi:repressor LexA
MNVKQKIVFLLSELRGGTKACEEVGARIRVEREGSGMNQASVAKHLGISQPFLSDIENGKKAPTLSVLEGISELRDRSLHWLLFGEEEPPERQAEGVGEEEAAAEYGKGIRMPLVCQASADPHSNVVWEPIDPPEYVVIPKGLLWGRARRDSMVPWLLDGQKFGYDPKSTPGHGDLAMVVLMDGRQLVKRVWEKPGGKILLESVARNILRAPVEPEEDIVVSRKEIREWHRIDFTYLRRD